MLAEGYQLRRAEHRCSVGMKIRSIKSSSIKSRKSLTKRTAVGESDSTQLSEAMFTQHGQAPHDVKAMLT